MPAPQISNEAVALAPNLLHSGQQAQPVQPQQQPQQQQTAGFLNVTAVGSPPVSSSGPGSPQELAQASRPMPHMGNGPPMPQPPIPLPNQSIFPSPPPQQQLPAPTRRPEQFLTPQPPPPQIGGQQPSSVLQFNFGAPPNTTNTPLGSYTPSISSISSSQSSSSGSMPSASNSGHSQQGGNQPTQMPAVIQPQVGLQQGQTAMNQGNDFAQWNMYGGSSITPQTHQHVPNGAPQQPNVIPNEVGNWQRGMSQGTDYSPLSSPQPGNILTIDCAA